MRLAIVLASLAGGGTERMRLHLIRQWIEQGIEIDLVVGRFDGPLCSQVPKQAQVYEIAPSNALQFIPGLRRYVGQRQPSHILSAGQDINVLTLWALRRIAHNIPIVISVHVHPSTHICQTRGYKRQKYRLAHLALRRLAKHAHGIIAVSQGIATELSTYLTIPNDRIHVVYNPTINGDTLKAIRAPLKNCPVPANTPWALFVGRFDYQKGLDILIDAFDAVIATQSEAHLVLMGAGNMDRSSTRRLRNSGSHKRIHIIDFQRNPLPWMRQANVLVLPSRYEGLPNVLIEALACGTQIVSTDCPTGPAEILDHGRYGQLIPVGDSNALCEAIISSLNHEFYVSPEELQKRSRLFTASRAASEYYKILTDNKILEE